MSNAMACSDLTVEAGIDELCDCLGSGSWLHPGHSSCHQQWNGCGLLSERCWLRDASQVLGCYTWSFSFQQIYFQNTESGHPVLFQLLAAAPVSAPVTAMGTASRERTLEAQRGPSEGITNKSRAAAGAANVSNVRQEWFYEESCADCIS